MVVPYGDPHLTHQRKNAFDAGEYNIGALANSLDARLRLPGRDPLLRRGAGRQQGKPYTLKNAICLHEEDAGILWSHWNLRTGQTEVRRSRRLVDLLLRDDRQLRLRLLLVLLPGRHDRARGQADRHPLDRRRRARRDAALRPTAQRRRALRPDPPALLQLPARPGRRRRRQHRLRGARRGRSGRSRQPAQRRLPRRARRCCGASPEAQQLIDPLRGPDLEDRQPGVAQRARRAGRLPAGAAGERRRLRRAGGERDQAGGLHDQAPLGDAVRPRTSCTPPATTRTSTRAAPVCRPGPPPTARSRTPTSSSGTRSARTTSRGRRTGR